MVSVAYLEARQLVGQERFDLALVPILDARRRGLPTERIRDEALTHGRRHSIRDGRPVFEGAEARFREALEHPRLVNQAQEWLDRIRFTRGLAAD